jgi:hypothetical protein
MSRLRTRRPALVTQPPSTTNGKRLRRGADFQYEPLDPAKHEIRLLEIAPGKPGSKIVGRLFNVSLDEDRSFEALSYLWGPPQPNYDISINGFKTFSVGRNLRKALDDLRQPDKLRVFWTDAICINQRDNGEKEHQIKLMRKIYASAQVVCAWLDHNVQPLDSAFEDLRHLSKGIELDDYADPTHWYPIADIFRNPYWRRLWIQQELILAKKIKIYCQRDVFDGQQLLEFQHRINDIKFRVHKIDGPLLQLSRYIDDNHGQTPTPQVFGGGILRARADMLKGHQFYSQQSDSGTRLQITKESLGSSLLQLFLQSGGLNMTEPRDRVYGILGLVTDVDDSEVRVDYSAPVIKVYSQVFSLFIEKHKSLDFLCFEREKLHAASRGDDNPTWMPHDAIDWSLVNASRACGSTTAKNASIDSESLVLSVEGFLVDTICFVGSRENFDELPILEWLPMLEGYCRRLWPGDPQQPLYEKEDVTSLLFPLLSEKRYRAMWNLDRPTPEERTSLLRTIRAAADNVDRDRLTIMNITLGQFTPKNVMSSKEQAACLPLQIKLNHSVFVGTEGGWLGTLHTTAEVEAGDQVWIIHGCRMPIVLRSVLGKQRRFTIVGHAVFPGLMRGEALSKEEDGGTALRSTTVELE